MLALLSRRTVVRLAPLLTSIALAVSGLAVLAAPATADPVADVRINEVESNGGTPVDWIELVNTGTAAVDVSGLKLKDSDDTHSFVVVPGGTTIAAGGFYAVDVDVTGGFGLGGADTARLVDAHADRHLARSVNGNDLFATRFGPGDELAQTVGNR